jgi:small redox-active disulfide protein 2
MVTIEVLGTGCAKCRRLYANADQAAKELNISAGIVKIEDIGEIVSRGVMLPPALFINGDVRAEGRISGVNEIKAMPAETKQ